MINSLKINRYNGERSTFPRLIAAVRITKPENGFCLLNFGRRVYGKEFAVPLKILCRIISENMVSINMMAFII